MQKRLGLLLLLLVVVNAACGQLTPDPTPLPPTNTPVPSSTSTPLPTPTNTATPTPDLPATAAAQETEAAQAILNKINPVLKDYGFSTNQGSLGEFLDQPVEIKLDTWMEEVYEPFAGEKEFYNYVMHTDITWDSTSGLAICGIYFHSGPNLDKSAQYKFSTLRLSGLPIWEVDYYKYGAYQSLVKSSTSGAIDQDAGATNEYVFIVDFNKIIAYANQVKLGQAHLGKLSDGRIALFGLQESGKTSCKFSNTWVWNLVD